MRYALLMALLLTGCGTNPRPGVPHLLLDGVQEACQEPRWGGSTQGQLVLHLLDVKRALRGCKAGAEALADYVKEK